jgi:hypothetical protein
MSSVVGAGCAAGSAIPSATGVASQHKSTHLADLGETRRLEQSDHQGVALGGGRVGGCTRHASTTKFGGSGAITRARTYGLVKGVDCRGPRGAS